MVKVTPEELRDVSKKATPKVEAEETGASMYSHRVRLHTLM